MSEERAFQGKTRHFAGDQEVWKELTKANGSKGKGKKQEKGRIKSTTIWGGRGAKHRKRQKSFLSFACGLWLKKIDTS